MALIGTLEDMGSTWKLYPLANDAGEQVGAGDVVLPDPAAALCPHSIYTRQPARLRIPAHYHDNAQFQIFISGSAQFGAKPIRPVTIHYATHQTGYGPIVSGDDGLGYITVRLHAEFGAHYADRPEERARMNPVIPRRQLTQVMGAMTGEALRALREPQVEAAIAAEPGGLAAWLVRVPPGGELEAPEHPGGAGRFCVVTQGTIEASGRTGDACTSVWTDANESFTLRAGEQGLEVAVCQFPRDALYRAETYAA
jgi:hypothetical protein